MDKPKLTQRFAERFNVDPAKLFETLKATAFRQRDGSAPTNEQMMALLVVADQYGLNPFTGEIYAFPDKHAGIIPVVGVDGWSRIINQHDQFDGMEFRSADTRVSLDSAKECPEWMECIIYRRDRSHPVKITEYLDEVYRPPFEGMGDHGPYRRNIPSACSDTRR
jgi:phage recombination protein Bet